MVISDMVAVYGWVCSCQNKIKRVCRPFQSINAFFDGYIHSRKNLKDFLNQFDNAIKIKIENENEMNTKFREVQQQIMRMLDCDPALQQKGGVISTYFVVNEVCVIIIQEFYSFCGL